MLLFPLKSKIEITITLTKHVRTHIKVVKQLDFPYYAIKEVKQDMKAIAKELIKESNTQQIRIR